MIPVASAPEALPAPEPPALVAPAPWEVSFGRIAGTTGPGTRRIVVSVDGRVRADRAVRGRRFSFTVSLPRRGVQVKVTAVNADGETASVSVGPVYGLPPAAAPTAARGFEDPELTRAIPRLARSFAGIAAAYVQDLETGAGASWNARARFPAASTLKLAIAVEVMRALRERPAPGSRLFVLLERMLERSDNEAANDLESWLGGSTSGGSAMVNATMRELGLNDSLMYGGYAIGTTARVPPIPARLETQPSFGVGKFTTAYDLARLLRLLHLAAGGRGALLHLLDGGFTPSDARFLLFLLAHTTDNGRLDRLIAQRGGVAVLSKAGWIETARHDAGLVYWPGGAFVAVVMTFREGGVGQAADVLAGRVAQAALERFVHRR